jgi:hypothetical protein
MQVYVLLGCDAASEFKWFPTFREDVVVSTSRVEMPDPKRTEASTTLLGRTKNSQIKYSIFLIRTVRFG